MLAIYQPLLSWTTCKHYYETDELPNASQPNPRKKMLKVVFGPLFPIANTFPIGWNWFYIGNRLQETQPNQILRKHPYNWYCIIDTAQLFAWFVVRTAAKMCCSFWEALNGMEGFFERYFFYFASFLHSTMCRERDLQLWSLINIPRKKKTKGNQEMKLCT